MGITPRESEVLACVANGESNRDIAIRLEISEGTVRKHLENVYRRLEVNNRVSAVLKSIAIIESNDDP